MKGEMSKILAKRRLFYQNCLFHFLFLDFLCYSSDMLVTFFYENDQHEKLLKCRDFGVVYKH